MNFRTAYSIFILSVLAASFVGQHAKVYAYLFDNENFTEQYCENKNNPESKCNGACQIRKIADDEKSDSSPTKPDIKSIDSFIVCEESQLVCSEWRLEERQLFHYLGIIEKRDNAGLSPPPDLV